MIDPSFSSPLTTTAAREPLLARCADAADKDVLSLMRQHARGRQKQRGGGGKGAVAGSGFRRGFPTRETAAAANAGVAPPPPQVLRERGSAVGFLPVRRQLFIVGNRRTDIGTARSRGGGGGGRS